METSIDPGNYCAKKTNCYKFTMTASCAPEAEVKYLQCLAEQGDPVWGQVLSDRKKTIQSYMQEMSTATKIFLGFVLVAATIITVNLSRKLYDLYK